MAFTTKDWTEEIQTYLVDYSGLGYVTGTDCFIGRIFLVDDVTAVPSLTLYEEDGALAWGRIEKQTRTVRFVARDTSAHAALDRAHDVYAWIVKHRWWKTSTFVTRVADIFKTPGLSPPAPDGVFAADLVVQFLVTSQ